MENILTVTCLATNIPLDIELDLVDNRYIFKSQKI